MPAIPATNAITTASNGSCQNARAGTRTRSGKAGTDEHLHHGRDRDGEHRDQHRLEGEAAEQRAVRHADRLEHGEVALALERREIDDRAHDDRRDHPQQHAHQVDRGDRAVERLQRVGRDIVGRYQHRAVRQVANGSVDEEPADHVGAAEDEPLRVVERDEDERDPGQDRGVVRQADDVEPLTGDQHLLTDGDAERGIEHDLARTGDRATVGRAAVGRARRAGAQRPRSPRSTRRVRGSTGRRRPVP